MTEKEKFHYEVDEMTSPEVESWMNFSWEMKQKAIDRIEDTSKFLATMISISLSVFLSLLKSQVSFIINHGRIIPILWLISLIMVFFVIFPFLYRFNPNSANEIRLTAERITKIKFSVLLIASLIYLTGFLLFCIL